MTEGDEDYLAVNRARWDERAPAHAAAYGVDGLVAEPDRLSQVVTFDLPRLGDVTGLRGVHLQCHIGTDTLSLARLGARMTGLDFSAASIDQARRITAACGVDVDYVLADVYSALDVLPGAGFDLVYTGIGALCWLPDIRRWAGVIAGLLRPGGRLFLRECHPVLFAVDETREELVLENPYFETVDPVASDDDGTYVDTDVTFTTTASREWNHGLGETVTALLDAGLALTGLEEHDSVPWEALPGRMQAGDDGEWRLTDRPWRIPLSYTLQAVRR